MIFQSGLSRNLSRKSECRYVPLHTVQAKFFCMRPTKKYINVQDDFVSVLSPKISRLICTELTL